MKALVSINRNPFDRLADREVRLLRKPMRIRALAPATDAPVMAKLNGRAVLRAEWRRRLRDGDHVEFHVLPRGGRGQAGGSNPMGTILSLAVLAFAPMAAGALLGPGIATTSTLFRLTTTAIGLAGSALISAVMPAPSSGALSVPTPSPTYSLGAQGNTARLEQPIPVQYGRMLWSPDFAALPYTEYVGADQYLYQLLCLGVGEFEIEDIRIDDTPVSSFAEISTEIIPPGGQVTLFPANVVTSTEVGGQELMGMVAATYAQSGTTITVTETAHGRYIGQVVNLDFTTGTAADGVYAVAATPTANSWTVTAAGSATTSGNVNIMPVQGGTGGFVASGAGSVASRLAVDVILPRGLYGTSGSTLTTKSLTFTVQAIQVDDAGSPIGGWVTLATETISDRTTTPIRKSFSYALSPAGRYAVRAWRTDAKDTASTAGHDLTWTALRSYLQEPASWGPVTLLAMRMKATNNLTAQASRLVKVLGTRKLPIWNGSSWSAPTATRSIAWALADAARNADYGGRLADSRIDLSALLALDAVWTARGDWFDARFDQPGTFWDAVTKIAAAGRAKPFLQGGVLRVARDDAGALPVAMFSMRNIVKGSFSVATAMPTADTADSVQVTYFDSTSWAPQRVKAPGVAGTMANPAKVELFGVTERPQAQRDAAYLAASNGLRRSVVTFTTEQEGLIPSILDKIVVQHDTPGWGAHAEALAWDPATGTLTVSEPMDFSGTGTFYAALRTATGGVSGPWPVLPGPTPYDLVFAQLPDMTPQVGSDEARTHVAFGLGNTWRAEAKVLRATPRPRGLVEIEAVIDDPSVYTAETGLIAPPISYSNLPATASKPVVRDIKARIDPANINQVLVSWEPAPGAINGYTVQMAEGNDPAAGGVTWTPVADIADTSIVLQLLSPYQTMIRVRGNGLIVGDWAALSLGSLPGRFWSLDPAAAIWTTGTDPFWRPL